MRALCKVVGLLVALGAVPAAHAQQATEMFIPIGSSPGLSGLVTSIGTIESADAGTRVLTLAGPEGGYTAAIDDRTQIWLDRSKLARSNGLGRFADCRVGSVVEIKYVDARRRRVAAWVKVELAQP